MISAGSSPLARGLQDVLVEPLPAGGIIPARAGFTRRTVTRVTHTWDHPRSRGVYSRFMCTGLEPGGSSPLARGLLAARGDGEPRLRIIPARAGFTGFRRQALRRDPDHPRSRGVYGRRRRTSSRPSGSSPLARGLPRSCGPPVPGGGIIPARAGFTPTVPCKTTPSPDHPRSRGVYDVSDMRGKIMWGSSPLARGLLLGMPRTRLGAGIIPARAGFTCGPSSRRRGRRDHPRSRGVYASSRRSSTASSGSSPLARGLHVEEHDVVRARGIIPARAGFTRLWASERPHCRDHPRSRGVYSSPLTQ